MKKERLAHGWGLDELSRRTGINPGHLSRIENGRRPPTEALADVCDAVFPERRGWFREYFEDSRAWTPPGFRSWPEYEDKAARLNVWSPGIVHGLFQTEDYARSMLSTLPGATAEAVAARLANRMERQHRVLYRDDPPTVCKSTPPCLEKWPLCRVYLPRTRCTPSIWVVYKVIYGGK